MSLSAGKRWVAVISSGSGAVADCWFKVRLIAREAAQRWKGRRVYLVPDPSLGRDEHVIAASNDKVLTLPAEARLVY